MQFNRKGFCSWHKQGMPRPESTKNEKTWCEVCLGLKKVQEATWSEGLYCDRNPYHLCNPSDKPEDCKCPCHDVPVQALALKKRKPHVRPVQSPRLH